MSSTNITREEAGRRARLLRAERTSVSLDLAAVATSDTFPSRTVLRFACHEPGSATWVDLIAPRVRAATLNGRPLAAAAFDGTRLRLDELAAENELVVDADCSYMRTGEGLHRFVDPVDDAVYVYSQFEAADARRMYACFDQPDLKSEFELTVTAPSSWQVVSNSPTPEPEALGKGVSRWSFAATPRISPYITALVAGPYHAVRDEYVGPHGTYPMGVFCRASLAEHLDAEEILTVTKQGFAFFEETFATPYPFSKYDQLFVPEFNAGAMENAGCVTFLEDYVFRSRVTDAAYEQRANTILHELAHMWFGDLVTMRWWDDLWLNESFAEWAAYHAAVEATRYRDSWTNFLNQRKAWAYRQDQLPSTHPIASDMFDLEAVEVNFDGITYAKGASALRQLVAWVGEEQFVEALRAYFATHAWENTSLPDLLQELERTSGRDLTGWTQEWLQSSGVNLLRPELTVGKDGTFTSVVVVQEPPAEPEGVAPILRSHRIAIGSYQRLDGALRRTGRVEVDVVGPRTAVPELVGTPVPDLLLLNDDDLTFAKVRLDETSMRTAVAAMGDLDRSLPRALVWSAAWDMTRDAELSAGDFLDLVIAGLPRETDVGVVAQLLRQLRAALDQYAAPENREGYLVRLGDALLGLARAAEPASDHQLAFVRALAGVARTPEQRGVLAGLLDGSQELPGLAVDTDLRWALLQRLVTVGDTDTARIDAELARDATATGQRQAAYARAAVPTAEAKAAAWAAAVESDALPNALLTATVGGFAQPDQRDLLVPYRERYFAALPTVWRQRTNEMAQTIAMGLYPFLLADDGTVAATDAFLAANPDLPFGARRLVVEGRDGVLRSIRAQRADTSR